MSRNLGTSCCYFCGEDVVLEEDAREITVGDAGFYFNEYRGMLVAKASCPACGTRYLAWLTMLPRHCYHPPPPGIALAPLDLSFRSTFNDEPGAADIDLSFAKKRLKKIMVREAKERAAEVLERLRTWGKRR